MGIDNDMSGGEAGTGGGGGGCNLVDVRTSAVARSIVSSGKSIWRDTGGGGAVMGALIAGGRGLEPLVGSLRSLLVGVLGDRRLVKVSNNRSWVLVFIISR